MEIKNTISGVEIAELIEKVVDSCCKYDDDGNFQYLPHYKDYAARVYMMKYYAGLTFDSEEESMEAAYGDIYDEIYSKAYRQWISIEDAISERIKNILDNENKNLKAIASALDAIAKKESPIDRLMANLADVIEKINEDWADIDIKKFAKDISNLSPNFSPEELVDAIIKTKAEEDSEQG